MKIDEYVFRLEVSIDYPLLMQIGDGKCDLDPDRIFLREGHLPQILTLLHIPDDRVDVSEGAVVYNEVNIIHIFKLVVHFYLVLR